MCATNRKSWTVRWTRKGEIKRLVDEFAERFPGTSYPAHGEWLRRTLARFARKVLEEHYRKEIAASTETLTLRARIQVLESLPDRRAETYWLTLRARIKVLEERIGVLAKLARSNDGDQDCPPGVVSCVAGFDCAACWEEWGLG